MQVVGTVVEAWRHPVKSLQGERLEGVALGGGGVDGDRWWGVRCAGSGVVLTAKREPRLLHAAARLTADGVEVRLPGGRWLAAGDASADGALSGWLDHDVRLAPAVPGQAAVFETPADPEDDRSELVSWSSPPGRFVDVAPVHLLTTASLAAAADLHRGGVWDVRRFRPNLVVETDGEGYVEDRWLGAAIRVGAAVLEVTKPCVRCVMTTSAQPGLERDLDIARAVNRAHAARLGVYATVRVPGRVAVGDPVVLAAGPT